MTVYKCYLKILKRNLGMIILYIAIFFSITMIIQLSSRSESYASYKTTSVDIAVCDQDRSPLSQGLISYLGTIHRVSTIENDLSVMQEKLFYRDVEYIIRIPENFYEQCLIHKKKLTITSVPGSYTSFYIDNQINSYLNSVETYLSAGFSLKEASLASVNQDSSSVELLADSDSNSETPAWTYYFRYIPYMFLGSLCYSMGYVLMAFQKEDIQKRMAASAVSSRRQNLEELLGMFTIGGFLWVVSIAGALIQYKKDLLSTSGFLYHLVNTLLVLAISLCISYLTGLFARNSNMISGLSNIISLGMCFLCGVFVPMDVMNKNVLTVAQFLPVYWYEKTNDLICGYHVITTETAKKAWQYMGIEALYVVALLAVILAVSRYKKQG